MFASSLAVRSRCIRTTGTAGSVNDRECRAPPVRGSEAPGGVVTARSVAVMFSLTGADAGVQRWVKVAGLLAGLALLAGLIIGFWPITIDSRAAQPSARRRRTIGASDIAASPRGFYGQGEAGACLMYRSTVSSKPSSRLLARLREFAVHLWVDADVVQWPGDDGQGDRGRAGAAGVATAEVPSLCGCEDPDDQPEDHQQRPDRTPTPSHAACSTRVCPG